MRLPRIEYPGAVYHVTSRGNARQVIFRGDSDRSRFLSQLRDNLETHAVEIYSYVLMDNHYHLVLRTLRANLWRFMQRLNSSYALYFRYKHARPGHAFQGRYDAKIVESDRYLLSVTRYVHLNPVKVAAFAQASAAERRRYLNAYRWSSYLGYVQERFAVDWVCYDVLRQYGTTWAEARRNYRRYTEAALMRDDQDLLEAMAASRYAIGDETFIGEIEARLEERRTGDARERDLLLPPDTVGIESIDKIVCEEYGIEPAKLAAHGRRVGEAKAVAVELTARLCGMTQREIGEHYGGITPQAVAMMRKRLREGNEEIRETIAKLSARATHPASNRPK